MPGHSINVDGFCKYRYKCGGNDWWQGYKYATHIILPYCFEKESLVCNIFSRCKKQKIATPLHFGRLQFLPSLWNNRPTRAVALPESFRFLQRLFPLRLLETHQYKIIPDQHGTLDQHPVFRQERQHFVLG